MTTIVHTTPSLEFLKRRCRDYLVRNRGSSVVVFPSSGGFSLPRQALDPRAPIDVVFWGDGLLNLSHRFLWAADLTYRLWVLSHAHRHLIEKMLGLPARYIGVLPREALLPRAAHINPWPHASENFTLVMSTRPDMTKNSGLTFKLAAALQKTARGKVDVLVCSPCSYSHRFQKELSPSDWMRLPQFLGDLGPNWVNKIKGVNPILLNLSTYIGEDFNVSAAQARHAGWPAILADCGAFKDIGGPSVLRVPVNKFISPHHPENLAKWVLKNMELNASGDEISGPSPLPALIRRHQLEKYQVFKESRKWMQLSGAFAVNYYGPNRMQKRIQRILASPAL